MPCMLLPCFEGPKEDWFCQLGHPRKIKNLLTYLVIFAVCERKLIAKVSVTNDLRQRKIVRGHLA